MTATRPSVAVIPAKRSGSRDLHQCVVAQKFNATKALRDPGYRYSRFRDDANIRDSVMRLTCVLISLAPTLAFAEPGVSHAHVPVLWALATGVAGGIAFGIVKLTTKSKLMRTPVRRWVIGLLLFAGFLFFLIPFFLVFGGILITGRTM